MAEFLEDVEFAPKPAPKRVGIKGKRPRSEDQIPWDTALKTAFDNDRPMAVQVTPDMADEARKRVDSAARFHDLAVTEGEARPGKVEGTVILAWIVRVPKKRGPRKPKTEDSAE